MATMYVSPPEPMKDWIWARASTERYANAGDYVSDQIRWEQDRFAKIADLQRLVDEGLASGISSRTLDEVRQFGRDQLAASQAK